MKKYVFAMILLLSAAASAQYKVAEWEHGWATSRIGTTRYDSPSMGFFIGFAFVADPEKCDRDEVVRYLEDRGGKIFQMGGYAHSGCCKGKITTLYNTKFSGACVSELLAWFPDVTNKESADRKLRVLLPELSEFVARLE